MRAVKSKTREIVPDFVFKTLKREERAGLPNEVKIVYFLALKGHPVPKHIVDDCRNRFPEYFERKIIIHKAWN